jgi:hypothetical protein
MACYLLFGSYETVKNPSARKGNVMTILDLILLLIIAAICCLMSIALGFVGAIIGMWLARTLSLPELFIVELGDVHLSGQSSAPRSLSPC